MAKKNTSLLCLNDKNEVVMPAETAKLIKSIVDGKKELEKQEKELRKALLKEMKDRNLKIFSCEGITITYVEPTQQEKFDKDKFREENEEIYNDYTSFETKAEYVLIKTTKENK